MYFNAKKRQLCDAKNASVLLAYAKPASSMPLLYRDLRTRIVQSLKWFDSVHNVLK